MEKVHNRRTGTVQIRDAAALSLAIEGVTVNVP